MMRSFVIILEENGGQVSGKNINPNKYTIISTWRKTVCYLVFLKFCNVDNEARKIMKFHCA